MDPVPSGPVVAAKKLAEAGKIKVGWVAAKVEALQPRQLRCHRCLESGHTMQRCTSATDRSDRCYRCGQKEHKAGTCTATPKCSLCSDLGKPAEHRLGGASCAPTPKKRGEAQTRQKGVAGNDPPHAPPFPQREREKNRGGKKEDGAVAPSPKDMDDAARIEETSKEAMEVVVD